VLERCPYHQSARERDGQGGRQRQALGERRLRGGGTRRHDQGRREPRRGCPRARGRSAQGEERHDRGQGNHQASGGGEGRGMMDATLFSLTIDEFESAWRVLVLDGCERIHAPFSFMLTCAAPSPAAEPIALDAFLARPARLSWPSGDDGERVVSGFIDRAAAVHDGYCFTLVPHVAELADVVDHRVFLGTDAATIAEEVLVARHLRVERRLTRALPPRSQ